MIVIMSKLSVEDKVVRLLQKAKAKYYNTDTFYNATEDDVSGIVGLKPGAITDQKFDKLEEYLKKLDPDNPYFEKIGAPVSGKSAKLPVPMPSLSKIKDQAGLDDWGNKNPGPYVESLKLDGVSLELVYHKGQPVKIYTRGNGTEGNEVSFLAPSLRIPTKLSTDMVLRGEVIMSKAKFKGYEETFANPRNMVSGLLNSKKISPALKHVDIIIYSQLLPKAKPSVALKSLKRLGFHTVPFRVSKSLDEESLLEDLVELKKSHTHEIDGIVITVDEPHTPPTSNPGWSIAYKSNKADDVAETTVISVEWNTGRTGLIFPTLLVEPTKLAGVTVKRVSGKSAMTIKNLGIGPGAVITMSRAGDVIPDIRSVVKKVKPQLPKDMDYYWEGENIFLNNHQDDQGVITSRLVYFFATLGVERFKEATVHNFVDAGYDTVQKILSLSKTDFVAFGSKTLNEVYDQMHNAVKGASLATLMAATGIFGRGFGTRRCAAIVQEFPDLNVTWQDIAGIEGFDTKTAKQFVGNLPEFKSWLKSTKGVTVSKPQKKKQGKLTGQAILFTGFRNKNLEAEIENMGGDIASSVGKATILLTNDPNSGSTKMQAARIKGIPIMTEQQFVKKFL